jgi:hypothetical protein
VCDGRREMRFAVEDPTTISSVQFSNLLARRMGFEDAGKKRKARKTGCSTLRGGYWWAANASRMASSPPTRRSGCSRPLFAGVLEGSRAVRFTVFHPPLLLPTGVDPLTRDLPGLKPVDVRHRRRHANEQCGGVHPR